MVCPEDRRPFPGGAVHFLSPTPPVPPPWGGGAYKFPGFGSRLGEGKGRVNRDALTRVKTPGRVAGYNIWGSRGGMEGPGWPRRRF